MPVPVNSLLQQKYETKIATQIRRMGVDDELIKMGIQEGDTVKICDYEFEYTE